MKKSNKQDQKKKDIQQQTQEITDSNAYMVCLRKTENEKAIEKAWAENDFCTIEKIFRKCGVPSDQMKPRMIEVLSCKDDKPQLWF